MGKKSFAILRASKITDFRKLGAARSHNARQMSVPNREPGGPRPALVAGAHDPVAEAKFRLDEHDVKLRKNGVLAIELVVGASPEWWRRDGSGMACDRAQIAAFEQRALGWVRETFGEANVLSAWRHEDERSPHWHVLVLPIDHTPRKRGPVVRLNARRWLGGADKLAALQSRFAEAVSDLGLERGERGSARRHERPSRWREREGREFDAAAEREIARIGNLEKQALLARQEGQRAAGAARAHEVAATRAKAALAASQRRQEALSAGVEAFVAGELVDAVRDQATGRRRLRFRDAVAQTSWSPRIAAAWDEVWDFVQRQVASLRGIRETARREGLERGQAAARDALAGELERTRQQREAYWEQAEQLRRLGEQGRLPADTRLAAARAVQQAETDRRRARQLER